MLRHIFPTTIQLIHSPLPLVKPLTNQYNTVTLLLWFSCDSSSSLTITHLGSVKLSSSRSSRQTVFSSPASLFLLFVLVLSAQYLLQQIRLPPVDPPERGRLVQRQAPRPTRRPPVCPNIPFLLESTPIYRKEKMALQAATQKMVAEFDYPASDVNKGVKEFLREMDEGLGETGTTMSQIPTYVTAVPNGKEKGLYLAVDLGGTNFRVCSIMLKGDTTFSLVQSKVAIPKELMVAKTSQELFSFLAKQIELFLEKHHNDHFEATVRRRRTASASEGYKDQEYFQLGFTFSFPVQQVGINKGYLIRWTKGFDIKDTVGKDVCSLLQDEINALQLPVKVAALVNDTVGTLMARSYTSPNRTSTLLGAIFGTGTNGAYVEKLDQVKKLSIGESSKDYDQTTGDMIINTEWGSFDNHLSALPNTPYDDALDKESNNPGIQMFEKRISGMFLGEILRRALLVLANNTEAAFCSDVDSSKNDIRSTASIGPNSTLYKQWGLDTSFLSVVVGDTTPTLKIVRQALEKDLDIDAASYEDAVTVKALAYAVGRRAARLSAVAIGAIVLKSHRLETDDVIDVGVDGSLVEYYPNFEEMIREALREIPEIGPMGERKIQIGIAKDGSGVGAALIAWSAAQRYSGSSDESNEAETPSDPTNPASNANVDTVADPNRRPSLGQKIKHSFRRSISGLLGKNDNEASPST